MSTSHFPSFYEESSTYEQSEQSTEGIDAFLLQKSSVHKSETEVSPEASTEKFYLPVTEESVEKYQPEVSHRHVHPIEEKSSYTEEKHSFPPSPEEGIVELQIQAEKLSLNLKKKVREEREIALAQISSATSEALQEIESAKSEVYENDDVARLRDEVASLKRIVDGLTKIVYRTH